MTFRNQTLALMLILLVASPATAWAFGAGAGCADLPEYYRAVGALEGMTGACDMSVEQARRIVAQQGQQPSDGQFAASPGTTIEPAIPAPRARRKHHRARSPRQ